MLNALVIFITITEDELQTCSTTLVLDISNTSSNIIDSRNTEDAAATKIQATYRGYATRKRLKSKSDRVFSATPSQAVPAVDNAPSQLVGDAIEEEDISDDTQNESGDTRTESDDTQTESGDTRTESGDTQTESDDTRNESGDTRTESGDTRNESGDTLNESDDTRNESGDTQTESDDTRTESGDTRTESGDTQTESDDTQNESGDTEKEHDSTETIEQINVEPGVVEESVERQEDKESVKQDNDEVLQESTADDTD